MAFKSGFVSIIGRPNVGKSTLLNQIIGQKVAIMSDKPQTTRNKITGVYNGEGGQIVFIDTPGIHKPQHKLGQMMVEAAQGTFNEVESILLLTDVTQEMGRGDEFILENLSRVKTPIILVLNKIDLISKEQLLPIIEAWRNKFQFAHIVPVSALKDENIQELLKILMNYMPEGPQYYPPDMITDQPERILVAELVREKLLKRTREEVPHSVAVFVELMEPRPNNLIYIGCTIYVERDSQKKIIIGKNGTMLKAVGADARREIQMLLGNQVFLELWVKVKKDWRNHQSTLKNLGFYEN